METSKYEFVYQSRSMQRLGKFFYLGMFIVVVLSYRGGIVIPLLEHFDAAHHVFIFFNRYHVSPFLTIVIFSLGLTGLIFLVIGLFGFLTHIFKVIKIKSGTLQLYSDHATLAFEGRTLTLKKREFDVEMKKNIYNSYWTIFTDGQKFRFYTAGKMNGFKLMDDTSLRQAMYALEDSDLPTLQREKAKMLYPYGMPLRIGEVSIPMGVSAAEAFANTPYYVDYDSFISVKNYPIQICLVRESSDPEHVVGRVCIVCEGDDDAPKTEAILSKGSIVDGTALDERIGVE